MSEHFVPLAALDEHPDNPYINWQLPLPEYSGVDDLVMDVHGANRLARLGALLEVTFQPGRRQEEDQPVVGGMSDDGTASAAATLGLARRKQRPDIYLKELYGDGGDEVPFWKSATVGVDLDSITDRLSRERNLRKPEAWAEQLNQVVRRGLQLAAIRNIQEFSKDGGDASMVGIVSGAMIGTVLTALVVEDFPPNIIVPYALIQAAMMIPLTSILDLCHQVKTAFKANLRPDMVPLHCLPYGIDRRARVAATALRHGKLIQYMPDAQEA